MTLDVHQAVIDKIIATLEAGEAGQWTCPWHRTGGGLPRNALTGKAYRGINTLRLWVGAQAAGYSDDRWATYKQWGEIGAQVRKGERSTIIVFFKELDAEDEDGRKRIVARASYGFNAAQVEGAPEAGEPHPASEWAIPDVFDGFVERTGARITHGGDAAFYQPSEDRIVLPKRDRFATAQGYASTAAHELVHWSGAKGRLDRELRGRFKTQAYAAEELVAELGSAFLMAELGLEAEPHPTHASYLASWLKLLKSDPKAIFTAASAASRAAGYLTALQAQMAEAARRPSPEIRGAPDSRPARIWYRSDRSRHAHRHHPHPASEPGRGCIRVSGQAHNRRISGGLWKGAGLRQGTLAPEGPAHLPASHRTAGVHDHRAAVPGRRRGHADERTRPARAVLCAGRAGLRS